MWSQEANSSYAFEELLTECHPKPQPATFQSGVDYLNALWEHGPSRMLFVRVDLGIRFEYQSSMHFIEFCDYFKRMIANRRSKPSIFRHYVGMIWRLEWTIDKSYHYHCLFIFDGARVRNAVYYGDAIGDYWMKNITEGIGTYWNSNREADNFPESGIGMIDRRDIRKRHILLTRVLAYLTKSDFEIREAILEDAIGLGCLHQARHIRTFGTSNWALHRFTVAQRS